MAVGNAQISRWVLVLEMLLCFTPLTLLFLAVMANLSRMHRPDALFALSVTSLGPIGLTLAFKIIVLNRPWVHRFLMLTLGVIAAWSVLGYSLHMLVWSGGSFRDGWRESVLISLLPALGLIHLVYLATRSSARTASTFPPLR